MDFRERIGKGVFWIYVVTFLLLFGAQLSLAANQNSAEYQKLISRARTEGSVRVIVKLPTIASFMPEGYISSEAVKNQRDDIVIKQDRLFKKMPWHSRKRSTKKFQFVPYVALEVDEKDLQSLNTDPDIESIEEDILVQPDLAESIPLIGADAAWSAGYTGAGQTIAILDTGVDKTHPFLSGKVVSEACYSGNLCPNGATSQVGPGAGVNCPTTTHSCDHGTHVAGIAAGNGGTLYSFSGVARDANLIAIQVFTSFTGTACSNIGASSPCISAYFSDILMGLEQVYSLRTTYSIASVNMSLGGGQYTSPCDTSSLKPIIDNLRSFGTATVIASGNNGFLNSLSNPACVSTAVSVGSTSKQDVVSYFSNSAYWLSLLAPGESINSSIPDGGFALKSGTSMATPHVTGTWAVLKSALPGATVDEILLMLQSTGKPILDTRNNITKQRIQVDKAVNELKRINLPKTPLYRYWSQTYTDSFYTAMFSELGWGNTYYTYTGIEGYIFTSQINGTTPVYRYYNSTVKDHVYTTNWGEYGTGSNGYVYEGVGGYIYPAQITRTVPLYRYYNSAKTDHLYTTNWGELGGGSNGYVYEGIIGYVYSEFLMPPCIDNDGDGYGSPGDSVCPNGAATDCNDNDASINPGATEICDNRDNNCNGVTDEYFTDLNSVCHVGIGACMSAGVMVCNANGSGTQCNATPGIPSPEVCNGIDDDCNGVIDNGVQNTYFRDADADTYGTMLVSTLACIAPAGYVSDNTDCNDSNASINPGAAEVCNGVDDNCNGQIDEGVLNTYYQDADGDMYGNASVSAQACTVLLGYTSDNTDCNDNNASINPGAPEVCGNGADDNCNTQVDEGCSIFADISITNSDSPDPVTPAGQNVTYTITVTNNGPAYATNVTVTDVLDASLTLVSATPGQGAPCAGTGTITCNLGNMISGSSATVTVVATTSTTPGMIGSTASVTATAPDPNMANNSAMQTTNVGDVSRISNISTRAQVGTSLEIMNGGFMVSGSTPKTFLIRARGPSMSGAPFNYSGTLADPFVKVYSFASKAYIAQNDNWQTIDPLCVNSGYVCGTPADITATGKDPCQPNPGQTVAPNGCSNESAILITLPPGSYSAIVSGLNLTTGLGLVEVFETDGSTVPRLVNISTRAKVLTGLAVENGGFVISGGTGNKKVLIRARGPSMSGAPFNYSGTLNNPFVKLYSFAKKAYIAQNDNWQAVDALCANSGYVCGTPADITATGKDPCQPNPGQTVAPNGCTNESAILITLPPGSYSAIVSGVSSGTGLGMFEVFEITQ